MTYDRRGCRAARARMGWTVTSVDEQADDAAALLRTLDLAPAVVVGHSGGASIACALVARHPDVVRHAVIYEPPLLAVVPNGEEVVGGFRATGGAGHGRGRTAPRHGGVHPRERGR